MYEPEPYILLIDDDDDDLEMLSTSLELVGVKTKSFSSASNAICYLHIVSDGFRSFSLFRQALELPGVSYTYCNIQKACLLTIVRLLIFIGSRLRFLHFSMLNKKPADKNQQASCYL